jgi:hypothetical protein
MTTFTIPTGTKSAFHIPPKAAPPLANIERIGVSAEIAAEMIGVGVRTMWNLAKEQKIRTVRIGTRVIFSVQSLKEFVDGTEKHKNKPESDDTNGVACVAEGKEQNEWQH